MKVSISLFCILLIQSHLVGLISTFLPPQTVPAASAPARAVWAVAVIFGWASAHCLAELIPSFTAKALSCNEVAAESCTSGLKFPKSLIPCKVFCAAASVIELTALSVIVPLPNP